MDDQLRYALAAILGTGGLAKLFHYVGNKIRSRIDYDGCARILIRDMDHDIISVRERVTVSSDGRKIPFKAADYRGIIQTLIDKYRNPPQLMSSGKVNSGLREALEVRYRTLQDLLL